MSDYQDFLDSLLPGNYALTKSMELTKVRSSGTLWYMKKFLVLYYYIFLSKKISQSRSYINEIIEIFDKYINSLDPLIQNDAREFFYPDDDSINLKSEKFKSFMLFANKLEFDNLEEKNAYLDNAKKCYFMLLMDSGGQSGIKRITKEYIKDSDFHYSDAAIEKAIFNATIKSILNDVNESHCISDNSVKYILSKEAMNKIEELSKKELIIDDKVMEIIKRYPNSDPKYRNIENDLVAFIRNERQILYYYGYFHSKSLGAYDKEFSSLTPIGELALHANAIEFLAIWEHQKIKMISQPVTVDINNVFKTKNDCKKFSISYNPYMDILDHIFKFGKLSLAEYKYIVSRKNNISNCIWNNIDSKLLENLDSIKKIVTEFNRKRDSKDEDSRKELLKYILGIVDNFEFDKNKNFLNLVSWAGRGSILSCDINDKKFEFYKIYKKISEYKLLRYNRLFEQCERNLRERYISTCNNISFDINAKTKIDWDLYNIHLDKFIYIAIIINIALFNTNTTFDNIESNEDIMLFIKNNFLSTLKKIGFSTSKSIRRICVKTVECIKNNNYEYFINDFEEYKIGNVLDDYRESNTADLFNKIKDLSNNAIEAELECRKRNIHLINLMKSYYVQRFLENSNLKCECCGEETFITDSNEPYVEFHHLIPFNIAFGPDHYLNLFALCPNCHRKIHYIKIEKKIDYYKLIDKNNYLHQSILDRLKELRKVDLLRSYHLEYLLAENAISQSEYDEIAA